jgi:hypothetical protein
MSGLPRVVAALPALCPDVVAVATTGPTTAGADLTWLVLGELVALIAGVAVILNVARRR